MQQYRPLLFLSLLLLALLPFVWRIISSFVTPFLVTCVLAIVVYPGYLRLKSRMHGRAPLAAFTTTMATVLLLGTLAAAAGVTLAREISGAYGTISKLSDQEGGWPELMTHSSDRVLDWIGERFPVEKEQVKSEVVTRIKQTAGVVLKGIGSLVTGLTSGLFNAVVAAIFLYFVLLYGESWVNELTLMVPLEPGTTRHLLTTLRDSIVANVNAVAAVALSQGLLLSIGFWMAGIASPILWGVVGGLASIIPIVGALLIWVPIVIGLAVKGAYLKAILLGLWCSLVVGSADNVIRPYVVGGRTQQHPVLIAVAIFGGTEAFGPPGVLLGPVILSFVMAVVTEIRRIQREEGAVAA